MTTLTIDVTPALKALGRGECAASAGFGGDAPRSVAEPSAGAVEAFQAALGGAASEGLAGALADMAGAGSCESAAAVGAPAAPQPPAIGATASSEGTAAARPLAVDATATAEIRPLPELAAESLRLGEELAAARPVAVDATATAEIRPLPELAAESLRLGEELAAARPLAIDAPTPAEIRPLPELTAENLRLGEELAAARPLAIDAPADGKARARAVAPAPVRPAAASAAEGVATGAEAPGAGAEILAAASAAANAAGETAAPSAAAVSGVAPVAGVEAADAVRRISPSEILVAAAEAVADTILVTPGLLSGEGQIRVQLRPDVLAGTEIEVNVAGREIAVTFLPQAADMGELIARNLPQLEQHLAARVHTFAVVAKVGRRSGESRV